MSWSPHLRSRPTVLVGAVLAALLALLGALVINARPAGAASTLAQLAEAKGKYFGSATDNPELTDSAYVSILTGGEFDSTTPGNAMKWDTIEPTQGTFNYTKGDAVVALAQANGMSVRGHTLLWHQQLPGWVSALPAAQLQAAMENHITNEVTHYRGDVFAWDVVNEPFNDDGTWRTSPFYTAMGTNYVAAALRAARAADPTVKLYINDYNIEGSGAKADAMYNLASSLKAAGVPLDGIGFQGHLATQYGFPSGMTANLQRFANLGLDVAITELDVRMPLPETSASAATQITYYGNVVQACLAVTRCVGITLWDYTDKYTWVTSTFPGQGNPLPWDSNLQKKPALYDALTVALGGTPGGGTGTTTPPAPGGCTATYRQVGAWQGGFQGEVTVKAGGTALTGWTVTWTLASGQSVSQLWNGTLSVSGSAVTVRNASYNGSVPANGTTTFGFLGTGSPSTPTLTCA